MSFLLPPSSPSGTPSWQSLMLPSKRCNGLFTYLPAVDWMPDFLGFLFWSPSTSVPQSCSGMQPWALGSGREALTDTISRCFSCISAALTNILTKELGRMELLAHNSRTQCVTVGKTRQGLKQLSYSQGPREKRNLLMLVFHWNRIISLPLALSSL